VHTLDLIHELFDASDHAARCPSLAHGPDGCRCQALTDATESRLVCDHFSLQLWCLAGPARWPVCACFPHQDGPAAHGRADVVVAYREFADGSMRPVFEQPSGRQYVTGDDGHPAFGVYFIPPEECPSGVIVEAGPKGTADQ
jgi:hypothetical protein